ncbi:hypothetical protein R6Q59_016171 [Mikania micrantha]
MLCLPLRFGEHLEVRPKAGLLGQDSARKMKSLAHKVRVQEASASCKGLAHIWGSAHRELLDKSTGFKGVEIFDSDHVQSLLPVELVNIWSLLIRSTKAPWRTDVNPPEKLIAANSMYRITQTMLHRYPSDIEPITKKKLFVHLKGMIGDILSDFFTNIPCVITMRCHESVIEKREESVRVAANLLGKTAKIIEKLVRLEVPSMDDDKKADID